MAAFFTKELFSGRPESVEADTCSTKKRKIPLLKVK